MLGARATMRMPREPPTRPMTIHGRRMPSRDEVRSLILPKNGFPTIASRAPIPVTTELTFRARLTSRGARKTREVLMKAIAYNEMKPHPTRRAAASSPRSSVGTSSGVGMPLDLRFGRERAKGIEPSPRAWEARVLPLNYARKRGDSSRAV